MKSKYSMLFGPRLFPKANEKVNGIARIVMLLSLVGFLWLKQPHLLLVGAGTLYILNIAAAHDVVDGFQNATEQQKEQENKESRKTLIEKHFQAPSKKNPFGNVLLTDIGDNPDKKAAAPSFDPSVKDDINKTVKRQTQMLHPDITNTSKQLYGDLYDKFQLDNSLMRFYATPNTRVSNDQDAFAKFLYGTMPSGKEDTPEGAMMRVKDNWQWINP